MDSLTFLRNEGADKKLVVVKDSEKPNAITLFLAREDHTLGNALRHELLRDVRVVFAGYRMPHPNRAVLEVQVETRSGTEPLDAVISSLGELQREFETLEARFLEKSPRVDEL